MSNIVFTPPGRDTPGYLRRARQALSFQESMQGKPSIKALDSMIDFLLQFVTEPTDKDEARELLLDASEAQFDEMLTSITGEPDPENPT
jgi:hypothetical protein